jgi:hypothetical protein
MRKLLLFPLVILVVGVVLVAAAGSMPKVLSAVPDLSELAAGAGSTASAQTATTGLGKPGWVLGFNFHDKSGEIVAQARADILYAQAEAARLAADDQHEAEVAELLDQIALAEATFPARVREAIKAARFKTTMMRCLGAALIMAAFGVAIGIVLWNIVLPLRKAVQTGTEAGTALVRRPVEYSPDGVATGSNYSIWEVFATALGWPVPKRDEKEEAAVLLGSQPVVGQIKAAESMGRALTAGAQARAKSDTFQAAFGQVLTTLASLVTPPIKVITPPRDDERHAK